MKNPFLSVFQLLFGIKHKEGREWYHIIGWWEVRRLLYNLLMTLIAYGSFQVAYITVLTVYALIGLTLNIGYSFAYLIDIFLSQDSTKNYSARLFLIYIVLSSIVIFGFALALHGEYFR